MDEEEDEDEEEHQRTLGEKKNIYTSEKAKLLLDWKRGADFHNLQPFFFFFFGVLQRRRTIVPSDSCIAAVKLAGQCAAGAATPPP